MDKKKQYKLKARNYWRENQGLIVLIAGAAILGVLVAGLNTWQYNNQINKFTLHEEQLITNNQDAEFNFTVDRYQQISEMEMYLELDSIQPETTILVRLNGDEIHQLERTSATFSVPVDMLEEENRVQLSRANIGFSDQRLTQASVTGYTSLRQLLFIILNFTAIILVFSPIGYIKYQKFSKRKRMEDEFPAFLRDVVQGTRAGMSLPQAIQNTEAGNYRGLGDQIDKMSAQLEWGIPFDKVLSTFAEETESSLIKRSTDTIIQAYTSGGNIQDVLESVGDNIRSIKQLQEERQSQLYGEMITGYIVYFIFIGILIALTTFLLPNLAGATEAFGGGMDIIGGGGGGSLQENIALYEVWFQRLVFIQALFSGLIVGKLAEGELKAGLKHSAILFAIGYLAVTFFL